MIDLKIRDEFPIMKKKVYLDTATKGLTPLRMLRVANEFLKSSSAGEEKEKWLLKVEETRRSVAKFINALPQ